MDKIKTFVAGNKDNIVKGAVIFIGVGVAAVVTALGLRGTDTVQIKDVVDASGAVTGFVVTETVD